MILLGVDVNSSYSLAHIFVKRAQKISSSFESKSGLVVYDDVTLQDEQGVTKHHF